MKNFKTWLNNWLIRRKEDDDEEEDRGTKPIHTKDLTDILSAIDMAAEKLCDINPDWECSSTGKGA
jgi:hypothetical protein